MGRPSNRTKDDTRIQLIETYLKLSSEEGLHDVNLRKLATRAKITYSTVHRYFGPPNDSIVMASANYVAQTAQAQLSKNLEPSLWDPNVNVLKKYVALHFDWLRDKRTHAIFWLYCLYLGCSQDRYSKKIGAYQNLGNERIQRLIEIEQKKGTAPKGTKTANQKLALTVQSLLTGHLTLAALAGRKALPHHKKTAIAATQEVLEQVAL